jgi:hypothetical protein
MDQVLELLHASELVQVDNPDDSYYLGTSAQLNELINAFESIDFDTSTTCATTWGWISDTGICLHQPFVGLLSIDELVKSFASATHPTIRTIRLVNPATCEETRTVFRYTPREWDFITDYLIMGSRRALKSATYDCVVNCTTKVKRNTSDNNSYIQLNWHDSTCQEIVDSNLTLALDKMDEWISAKRTVLVHCEKGISRSGACVLAYLMRTISGSTQDRTAIFDEAYTILITKRPIAKPNSGFLAQLRSFPSFVSRVG